MAKTILNLTTSVVIDQAERILNTYPVEPYQCAFSESALREKLICYVLSRVPCFYTVVDDSQSLTTINTMLPSQEQQHQVEALIHQGIQHLLPLHQGTQKGWCDRDSEVSTAASSWFG